MKRLSFMLFVLVSTTVAFAQKPFTMTITLYKNADGLYCNKYTSSHYDKNLQQSVDDSSWLVPLYFEVSGKDTSYEVPPEFMEAVIDNRASFVDSKGKKLKLMLFSVGEPRSTEEPVTQTNTNQSTNMANTLQTLDKDKCSYKGIPLKGKVQVVTSFPDIKVQIVTSFPDIKVKTVTSFPNDCGEWQFVESFPDFKIQYVTSFPDIKVQFVESFPGMR